MDSYIHYGLGPHTCLGKEASKVALTAMLRVVGGLENLRRAPGEQGQLKKVPREGGFYVYMKEDHTSYFPFPMSMSSPPALFLVLFWGWVLTVIQRSSFIMMEPCLRRSRLRRR